jgi:hypothetical protein
VSVMPAIRDILTTKEATRIADEVAAIRGKQERELGVWRSFVPERAQIQTVGSQNPHILSKSASRSTTIAVAYQAERGPAPIPLSPCSGSRAGQSGIALRALRANR